MGEEYSVAELSREVSSLKAEVSGLKALVGVTRAEMRRLNSTMVGLGSQVTKLRLQGARWSVLGGIATGLVLKGIDHIIK